MPQLSVTIRADGVQLTPGTSAAFTVEVRNLGSVVDRYRCELVGLDPSWWTVSPASMELFPQSETSGPARPDTPPSVGRFQVTLYPPRTSAAKAGPWPFGAKVTSEHNPTNRLVEEASVVFLPFGALDADLRPAVVSGRFGTTARLHLANNGNRTETVEISGSDRAARITFDVRPPRVTLTPGETTVVPIGLAAGGARLFGGTETRPFSLEVRPAWQDTPPVTLSGTLEKSAIIPSGLPVALGGLLALGMGAFAIWAAFLRPPSSPVPAAAATIAAPSVIVITAPPPTAAPSATLPPTPSPSPSPSLSPSPTPTGLPCTQGPVDLAYNAMGGASSFLGAAISCDNTLADGGVSRNFEHGSMFVAPGSGSAFALAQPLRDYWLSLGGPSSQLGYPIANAKPGSNGDGSWSTTFQHGQASWTPTAGGWNCIEKQCLIIILNPSFPIFVKP